MQGAKTSKTMFPCGRRVHLHKSAGFKTSFEQIQKSHKNHAKVNNPKMIEQTTKKSLKKRCGKKSEKLPKNTQKFRLWIPFGSQLLDPFPLWCVLFATCFSDLWKVPPWTEFGLPGHPWTDFVTFLKDLGSKFAPNFKDSRATNVNKRG